MQIHGVLESCLYVDDLIAARVFYDKVLCLALHSQVAGRHVFFGCGKGMFLVFQPDATAASTGEVPAHGAHGPGHVAFAVREQDLAAWRERLGHHGVEIEQEIEWPSGGHSLYFRDPAGNSVELATPQTWNIANPD